MKEYLKVSGIAFIVITSGMIIANIVANIVKFTMWVLNFEPIVGLLLIAIEASLVIGFLYIADRWSEGDL